MKHIMFVCTQNSARSQMAEGFAHAMSEGEIHVTSAGLNPSHVNPGAIATMNEVGVDISSHSSKPLSNFNPDDYDAVISLCGCGVNLPPEWLTRDYFDDWQLDDPSEHPDLFPNVRDQIKERVENLLATLNK